MQKHPAPHPVAAAREFFRIERGRAPEFPAQTVCVDGIKPIERQHRDLHCKRSRAEDYGGWFNRR
jgi:hypothetical protein